MPKVTQSIQLFDTLCPVMSSPWVCTMDEEAIAELQTGSATLLPLGTAWQGTSPDKEVKRGGDHHPWGGDGLLTALDCQEAPTSQLS